MDEEIRKIPGRIASGAVAIGSGTSHAAGVARDAMVTAGHRAKERTKNAFAAATGVKRTPMKEWSPPLDFETPLRRGLRYPTLRGGRPVPGGPASATRRYPGEHRTRRSPLRAGPRRPRSSRSPTNGSTTRRVRSSPCAPDARLRELGRERGRVGAVPSALYGSWGRAGTRCSRGTGGRPRRSASDGRSTCPGTGPGWRAGRARHGPGCEVEDVLVGCVERTGRRRPRVCSCPRRGQGEARGLSGGQTVDRDRLHPVDHVLQDEPVADLARRVQGSQGSFGVPARLRKNEPSGRGPPRPHRRASGPSRRGTPPAVGRPGSSSSERRCCTGGLVTTTSARWGPTRRGGPRGSHPPARGSPSGRHRTGTGTVGSGSPFGRARRSEERRARGRRSPPSCEREAPPAPRRAPAAGSL